MMGRDGETCIDMSELIESEFSIHAIDELRRVWRRRV